MGRVPSLILALLLAACGGTPGGGEDVVYADLGWQFGKDSLEADTAAQPADALPGADTPAPDDAPVPGDTPAPVDTLIPDDTPTPADTPTPPDTNFDTGPCGGCPADFPNCVSGVCKCTPFSCVDGTYCKGGGCVTCDVDAHCGPDCTSCSSLGQFCGADGATCLGCDDAHPCSSSQSCIDNVCTPCEALGFCGPDCLTCPAETPACVAGACACSASSCPPEHACDGGVCVPCTASDPGHCGPTCLACGGGTPHCQGGACALCNSAGACGPSCQPCGGALAWCPPDGSGCVECTTDAQCGAMEHCAAGSCVPDCSAQGCTSNLTTSGNKCAQARVIGRTEANVAAGAFQISGDTTNDGDDDNLPSWGVDCWDAQDDNFYRLWLNTGDQVIIVADPVESDYQLSLKAYQGTGCEDLDNLIKCAWDEDDGDPESIIHTAGQDDWVTIVVDGASGFSEEGDWGHYDLAVTLICADSGCCCP
ncbi:MAG: hypothetical protein ABIK09_17910 [Pseudomonadota bacterium]